WERVELVDRVDDLRDVQEAVSLEAEVDERRLHAGKNLRHPALVDVADDAALAFTLDEDFSDEIVFEDGHHRFVAIGGDDHLLGHAETPRSAGWGGERDGRERKKQPSSPSRPFFPPCPHWLISPFGRLA